MGLHVGVQTVQSHHLQQRAALDGLLGQVGQVDAGRVALVLDVHLELLLLHAGGQIVDVLHHQVPVALRGVVAGVLQCLDKERLVDVRQVAGKLAHLERLSAVGVLEGDGQHLVGLQAGLQRDGAEGRVDGIFRRCQQPCRRQLLVVGAALHLRQGFEGGGYLVDAALGGVYLLDEGGVERVGVVRGHGLSRRRPGSVAQSAVLAEVGERHDVTGVARRSGLVRHPYLHAVDLHARRQVRQCRHGLVVLLAEELRQEEVAVLLVVGGVYLEGRRLRAAF